MCGGKCKAVQLHFALQMRVCVTCCFSDACRGNGFITDPSLVSALQITDPTSFFTSALSEPWINQVSRHFPFSPRLSE